MSSRMRSGALCLAVVWLFLAGAARAQETAPAAEPTPEQLARELLELSGAGDLGKQVMAQMVESFRGMDSEGSVPPEFWDEFLASVDSDELVELVVPIYVRHLTIEEMKAAIEFYSSPVGRSLIEKLPAISQESMVAGQAWGEQIGRELVERLQGLEQEPAASSSD